MPSHTTTDGLQLAHFFIFFSAERREVKLHPGNFHELSVWRGCLIHLSDFAQDYTVADVQGTLEELEQDQICIVEGLLSALTVTHCSLRKFQR